MKLAAWVLICIGFVMAEDPSASPSTTTTPRPTTTTTSAPKAKATSGSVFYNFGNNIELSFETISYITGGISIFLLLIIILVAFCHKLSKNKLAARVSRLGADQERSHVGVGPRHIKVAPMPDTDSYPNPPDKLISKSPNSPRSPRNDNQLTVTRSERSAKAKHVDVEGVKRQSLSSGSGKQQSSTIQDDNLTPVGNRGAKSKDKASPSKDKKSPRVPEKSSPSKDKKSPRVPEKASPSKDKRSPRVPAARRATDGLL